MAIPPLAEFNRAVLEALHDSGERLSRKQIFECVVAWFNLTEEDKNQITPSTGRHLPDDRAYWAAGNLKRAGLLTQPARGYFQITHSGRNFLTENEGSILTRELTRLANQSQHDNGDVETVTPEGTTSETDEILVEIAPEEAIEQAYQQLRNNLANDLLANINDISPARFEDLVADLLVRMGYGEAGERGPRSRDGGIDGVINQDPLGLEKVYIQAKRWRDTLVRLTDIHAFSGSLVGARASKGVFITTSRFTKDATDFAAQLPTQAIRLVDGPELARLMIAHGVGVVTEYTYEIKKLDENYFADDV